MKTNDTGSNGSTPAPGKETGPQTEESQSVLDDELNSAASPFLYLLSALLIAVAAYFAYNLLRG
jgi:hypothetical protein